MAKPCKSVLVISDTHFPYQHPDAIRFLAAIKNRYSPERVVHIGDEVDFHAMSFHDHDPDLASPGQELANARLAIRRLVNLFPIVDVLESNHGSLVYRRAKAFGLPNMAIRSYREVLEAPEGWKWHSELVLKLSDGSLCLLAHGKTKNALTWGRSVAMHTVNGHFHEDFSIQYWKSPRGLFWSMVVSCLIDDKGLAFAYNKLHVKRPILGVGLILNGHPVLVPMLLTKAGRWNGVLP